MRSHGWVGRLAGLEQSLLRPFWEGGCSGCIWAYCCFRTCYEEGDEDVELGAMWLGGGMQTSLGGQHLAGVLGAGVQLWLCFLHIVLADLLSASLGACGPQDGVQHSTGLLGWEPSSVLLCW